MTRIFWLISALLGVSTVLILINFLLYCLTICYETWLSTQLSTARQWSVTTFHWVETKRRSNISLQRCLQSVSFRLVVSLLFTDGCEQTCVFIPLGFIMQYIFMFEYEEISNYFDYYTCLLQKNTKKLSTFFLIIWPKPVWMVCFVIVFLMFS